MQITEKIFIAACKKLKAEADGKGPIVGFSLSGGPFSITYDFDDEDQESAKLCFSRFIFLLNEEMTDEQNKC